MIIWHPRLLFLLLPKRKSRFTVSIVREKPSARGMSQTSLYKNGRAKCRLQGAYHLSPQEENEGKKENALKCLDTFLHLFGPFKAEPFTRHKTQDLAILFPWRWAENSSQSNSGNTSHSLCVNTSDITRARSHKALTTSSYHQPGWPQLWLWQFEDSKAFD